MICTGCVVNARLLRVHAMLTVQPALENHAQSPLAMEEKQQIIKMPRQPVTPTQDKVNIYINVNCKMIYDSS